MKKQLMDVFPSLTEEDFATYESDLYVVAYDYVIEWLKANNPWTMRYFIGQTEVPPTWNGSGKICVEIHFGNDSFWEQKCKESK